MGSRSLVNDTLSVRLCPSGAAWSWNSDSSGTHGRCSFAASSTTSLPTLSESVFAADLSLTSLALVPGGRPRRMSAASVGVCSNVHRSLS